MITLEQIKPFQLVQDAHLKFLNNLFDTHAYLFKTDVEKDELWETYINSFPEEENIRQSFTCNACRQFIKSVGNLVVINPSTYELISIWDFYFDDPLYQTAVDNLADLVKSRGVVSPFLTKQAKHGTKHNHQSLPTGEILERHHFFFQLPKKHLTRESFGNGIGKQTSLIVDARNVLIRALEDFTVENIDVVLDLIASDQLYRAESYKESLLQLKEVLVQYEKLTPELRNSFSWLTARQKPAVATLRNTLLGELLKGLCSGNSLEAELNKWNQRTVPSRYLRVQTEKVSAAQIKRAQTTLAELGLSDSIYRRLAQYEDVGFPNMLFVDREVRAEKMEGDIFAQLAEERTKVNPKTLENLKTISLSDFLDNVLPRANSLEILFQSSITSNLMSLIAPKNLDVPALTAWDNGFSWYYKGGVADSLKERIKRAGGKVDAPVNFRLGWNCADDLDAHLILPTGKEIAFNNQTGDGFRLDVDMNAGRIENSIDPVENIFFSTQNPPEGTYKFYVHNFTERKKENQTQEGFEVELDWLGETYSWYYPENMRNKERIIAIEFIYKKGQKLKIVKQLQTKYLAGREIWGLQQDKFHKVSLVTLSPNYWGYNNGNKHIFFFVEGAQNQEDNIQGFFNEMLKLELREHRKVFELLANKMQVAQDIPERQLSGFGFSSSLRKEFVVKVTGATQQRFKVIV